MGAYLHNANRFLHWTHEHEVPLRATEPFHVSAYIELLVLTHGPASVRQHLATLRMLGAFLVVRQVLRTNPAADVRGPKHVVTVGKTPVLQGEDVRVLFDSILRAINPDRPSAIWDRAFIGIMAYTFARVPAACRIDIEDYHQVCRRMMIRLKEKGGRSRDIPMHHTAIEHLVEYLKYVPATKGPLFRSVQRTNAGFTDRHLERRNALDMVKRRCKQALLGDRFTNHSFRASGIRAHLKNEGRLEKAQFIACHASPTTTKVYDRREQEATLDEMERIIF